jgi:hypothetical protein
MPLSGRIPGAAVVALAVLAPLGARAQDTCAKAYESAQELRRGHELTRARAEMRLCERACPKQLGEDCSAWRREVEAEIASVVLDVRAPDGKPLAKVRITVDGTPLLDATPGDPVELDPGAHTLAFEDEAGARVEAQVKLDPGERGRTVAVRFPAPRPVPPPPPPPPPPRVHTPLPYVLGGVGLAGLTVGAVLGIKGQVDRASLTCAPRCNKATQVDPIAAEWWTGAAAAIAGGALLGGGVVVWLVEDRGAKARTAVALVPGPGWIGVAGRF